MTHKTTTAPLDPDSHEAVDLSPLSVFNLAPKDVLTPPAKELLLAGFMPSLYKRA